MAELRNRGNGSWQVTLYNGYDASGKHKRVYRTVRVDPSKTENAQRKLVEREAAKLQADLDRHILTVSRKVTINALCDEFLEFHVMQQSTRKWYENLFRRICGELGSIAVQDLTPQHIRNFYKALASDTALTRRSKSGKLSGEYRLHYHRALSSLLTFALRSGLISVSPAQAVDPPRSDTKESQFFDECDVANLMQVLSTIPDPLWKAFFHLAIFTSCRPGELIGLNWSDLDGNTLHIQAGANRDPATKKTIRTSRPKTKASDRFIILPDEVLQLLQQWKTAQLENKLIVGMCWPEESVDAVFTGAEGYRLDLSTPTQKWRKIQRKYNLKDANLYSLRHTGASLLIAAGCDAKEVSSRLGHSRVSTTLDVYCHCFQNAAQHTTDVLTAAIHNAVNAG